MTYDNFTIKAQEAVQKASEIAVGNQWGNLIPQATIARRFRGQEDETFDCDTDADDENGGEQIQKHASFSEEGDHVVKETHRLDSYADLLRRWAVRRGVQIA